jgi:RHS repeat-associated protein
MFFSAASNLISQSPGKERDAETGLDYFYARYYSSAQARFTSSDSPSYANRKNPQSWNLYAYALNNPISFADADGHEIVCANNSEQCKKDAATATGNAEAAKRVGVTITPTKHSFLGIHWTTSRTTIAISGDIKSFRALGENAKRLADLVTGPYSVTVNYGPAVPGLGVILDGGSTSRTPSMGRDPQSWTDADHPNKRDTDAEHQGIPQANSAEAFGHEVLGHIWGELVGNHPLMLPNHRDPSPTARANMRDSLTGENAVRKFEGENERGQKLTHHNYNNMPEER